MLIAPIRTASGIRFAHDVGALLVAHDVAAVVGLAGGHGGGALERHAARHGVDDVGGRRGTERLAVGPGHGGQGGAARVLVARRERRVVGSAVVVGPAGHDVVQQVDLVGLGLRGPPQVGRAVGGLGLPLYLLQGRRGGHGCCLLMELGLGES